MSIFSVLTNYTVNTNKSNMELFAGIANMMGEGLPLSYLFITTERNAVPHTKQAALIAWMSAISSLGINPQFVLSNKDQLEINALKHVWPQAKHQLCLWHILRALKRQLAQNENPGSYNALEAHDAFPVIDAAFVPLGQMSAKEKVITWSPTRSSSFWLCRIPICLLLRSRLHRSACVSMGGQPSSPLT
jgi:hypothetical protein